MWSVSAVFQKYLVNDMGYSKVNVGIMSSHVAPKSLSKIRIVKETSPTSVEVTQAGLTTRVMKQHDLTEVVFFDHIPVERNKIKSGHVNTKGVTLPVVGETVFGATGSYEAPVGKVVSVSIKDGSFTWKPQNRPTIEGESGMPIIANVGGENVIVGRHVESRTHNQESFATIFANDCRVAHLCGDSKEPTAGIRSIVQDEFSNTSGDFMLTSGVCKPLPPHPATLDLMRRICMLYRFFDAVIKAQPIQNNIKIETPQNIERLERTMELAKMMQRVKSPM